MKKAIVNHVLLKLSAISENEAFSRIAVAGFLVNYPVTTEELCDIKTAVSEAVTNAIVHGYRGDATGVVSLDLRLYENGVFRVSITDRGCGIEDVDRAKEPFFTTDRAHERTGMGFCVMETFMDRLFVKSELGHGCRVVMEKKLSL